ncbi:DNA recombination protein RmuC [Psittacicella hinzii]|nr:DNA recombination protein RmuC [Psittacicella hinzii]
MNIYILVLTIVIFLLILLFLRSKIVASNEKIKQLQEENGHLDIKVFQLTSLVEEQSEKENALNQANSRLEFILKQQEQEFENLKSTHQQTVNKLENQTEQYHRALQDKEIAFINRDNLQRELNEKTQQFQEQKAQFQSDLVQLKQQHEAEIKRLADNQNQQAKNFKEQTESSLKLIKEEVQNQTAQLIQQATNKLSQDSEGNFKNITKPLVDKMESLNKQAVEVLEKNLKSDGELLEKINSFDKQFTKFSLQTDSLTQALRGSNKKVLGNWGEAQLEVLLESVGLIKGIHFNLQVSAESTNGKKYQPDCVLNLPNRRHVIVDSKVTLNAYLKIIEATDKESEALATKELVKNIQDHIRDLAGKQYQKLVGLNSYPYVLMYVPIDNVLAYLAKEKSDIYLEAQKHNIVIVSNATLIPLLYLIDNLWKNHEFQSNFRDLALSTEKLFQSVETVAAKSIELGTRFGQTIKAYSDLNKQLSSNQGLIKRMTRFTTSASKALEQLEKLETTEDKVQESFANSDNFKLSQLDQVLTQATTSKDQSLEKISQLNSKYQEQEKKLEQEKQLEQEQEAKEKASNLEQNNLAPQELADLKTKTANQELDEQEDYAEQDDFAEAEDNLEFAESEATTEANEESEENAQTSALDALTDLEALTSKTSDTLHLDELERQLEQIDNLYQAEKDAEENSIDQVVHEVMHNMTSSQAQHTHKKDNFFAEYDQLFEEIK